MPLLHTDMHLSSHAVGYREAEAKEELTYSLLRARFIFPPRVEAGKTSLPADFDFSTYLRLRCVHEVAHTLHVSPATWSCIILFLGFILYMPVLEEKYAHVDITVQYVIGLGWLRLIPLRSAQKWGTSCTC